MLNEMNQGFYSLSYATETKITNILLKLYKLAGLVKGIHADLWQKQEENI